MRKAVTTLIVSQLAANDMAKVGSTIPKARTPLLRRVLPAASRWPTLRRPAAWQRSAWIGLGCLAMILAIGVAARSILPATQPVPDARGPVLATRPAAPSGSPRATLVLQPPIIIPVRTSKIATGERAGPMQAFSAPLRLEPPYAVVDSVQFRAATGTIHLAFVEGLGRDELCLDDKRQRYACGLRGRASLVKRIAGHDLICWPTFAVAGSIAGMRHQCFADGLDVAGEQAEAGFAKATLPSAYPYIAGTAANAPLPASDDWTGGVEE